MRLKIGLLLILALFLIFFFIAAPMLKKGAVQDIPEPPSAQDASVQQGAATQTVDALGKELKITNPHGYCTIGKSKKELDIMAKATSMYGGNTRLLHLAYPCSELSDYNKGLIDDMNHWMVIVLLGQEGKFQSVDAAREDFLAAVAEASPQGSKGERGSDTQIEQFGRDENAVYYSVKKTVKMGSSNRQVLQVFAITLVKRLPLQIYVLDMDNEPQTRTELKEVLQDALESLIIEN